MTAAAFQGDYCDLKFVKSRKVAQITVEIPIEQAAAFVAAFGAPNPAEGVPVALARLQSGGSRPEPVKERKKWSDLPCSQQAAIRCGEPAFWRFIAETSSAKTVNSAEGAAQYLRLNCGVESRADLDKDIEAAEIWREIERDYQVWMTVPA